MKERLPPDGPEATCSHCGRSFPSESILALHRGRRHGDALSAAERDAYERAVESENEDLRMLQLRALAALVALYFGFLLVYAVFP